MSGLIGLGQTYREQAEGLASKSAGLETQRNQENRMIDSAQKQQMFSLGTSGAIAGAYFGAQAGGIGGPPGALIGAGIGLLAGRLFS